jgi:hypothetical protein
MGSMPRFGLRCQCLRQGSRSVGFQRRNAAMQRGEAALILAGSFLLEMAAPQALKCLLGVGFRCRDHVHPAFGAGRPDQGMVGHAAVHTEPLGLAIPY